jgi:hypothetical protein
VDTGVSVLRFSPTVVELEGWAVIGVDGCVSADVSLELCDGDSSITELTWEIELSVL